MWVCAILPGRHTSSRFLPYTRTLQRKKQGTGSDIWLRNVQLGGFGFVLGLVAVFQQDGQKVAEGGFFQGYSMLVWSVITVNAAGGLLIAVVVKYADNILKGM